LGANPGCTLNFSCFQHDDSQGACWTQHRISDQLPDWVWTKAPHMNFYIPGESLILCLATLSNVVSQLCLVLSGTS